MLLKHSAMIAVVVILVVSLACRQSAPVAAPVQDSNVLNTSIAKTVAARQTEAALTNPETATFTFTPQTPTTTPEPVLSATPDFTATPETPLITVSKDTNCRVGPGAVYERVGILLVGEVAEVVGRDPRGEYWLIINPDEGSEYCWVWGEYATVTGNIITLLVQTPPPAPITAFTASFAMLQTCGSWWVDIKLTNASGALFKSISLIVTDTDTKTVVTMTDNKFIHNEGCSAPNITDALIAGASVTVSSPPFAYKPSGHTLNAKVTLCTDINQNGTCVKQEFNFKP